MATPPRMVSWPGRRLCLLAVSLVTCLASVVAAVGKDKAIYIGGTLSDFPRGAHTGAGLVRADRVNVEGRINTLSDSEFVFDAGTKGSIAIPYGAIGTLIFGRIEPFGRPDLPEPRFSHVFPKDFRSRDHYVLTIAYRDQTGTKQAVALWLGTEVIRPALATLEARSGKQIQFADTQGCAQYKTPEECGYAGPGALKGVRRIFVDTGGDIQSRDRIISEIQKAKLGVEVLDGPAGAEVILNYDASRGLMGANVGIGEIYVMQDRARLVSQFAEASRTQNALATGFARTFVDAYKKDNRLK